jgi:subtilase family serine protease
MPGGTFFVLACADGLSAIHEFDETNNCLASSSRILVSAPDLVETAVSNPPAAAVIGSFLTISDTVTNQGNGAAGSFVVRYYLSFDQNKESWDTLLGSRTVTSLAAGASSTASVTVQIPSMSSQTFQVLACADDLASVAESSEFNNCRASTGMVVTGPDLVVTSLTDPPNVGFRGDMFMVMDMVLNQGNAATSAPAAVWYYLSTDRVRGGADWLIGGRGAPPLAVNAVSAGGQLVTIPQNLPAGTYFLLACGDDIGVITEQNEANNCRASANPISVFTIRF